MTKKHFIKLVMSQGVQRNEANEIAERYNSRRFSYASAYINFIMKTRLKESFEILGEAVGNASDNLSRLICALKERNNKNEN